MPIFALQRSYKYMMYATKQPSLRINQADLKCKNGCGYYGNADWDGEFVVKKIFFLLDESSFCLYQVFH